MRSYYAVEYISVLVENEAVQSVVKRHAKTHVSRRMKTKVSFLVISRVGDAAIVFQTSDKAGGKISKKQQNVIYSQTWCNCQRKFLIKEFNVATGSRK